ncbi:MAG: hypothetical protein ACRD7E_25875 [Bryobacteraceae bacterium]
MAIKEYQEIHVQIESAKVLSTEIAAQLATLHGTNHPCVQRAQEVHAALKRLDWELDRTGHDLPKKPATQAVMEAPLSRIGERREKRR